LYPRRANTHLYGEDIRYGHSYDTLTLPGLMVI